MIAVGTHLKRVPKRREKKIALLARGNKMPKAPTDLPHRTPYAAPDTRSAACPFAAPALAPMLS